MLTKLNSIGDLQTYTENGILLFRLFDYTLRDVEEAVTNNRVIYEDILMRRERQYSIYQRFKEIATNKEGYGHNYIIFQLHNLLAPYFGHDILKEAKEERAKFDANSYVSLQQVFTDKIAFLDDILDELEEIEALTRKRKTLTAEQPTPVATSTEAKEPSDKQKKVLDSLAKHLNSGHKLEYSKELAAKDAKYQGTRQVHNLYKSVEAGTLKHEGLAEIIVKNNASISV